MSAVNPPVAEEVCILALNPYDAGQRALWHLDRIGSVINSREKRVGPDLELLYVIPQKARSSFARSSSTEELGLHYGEDLHSPRAASAHVEDEDITPRYVKISDRTRIKFLNPISVAVFSLDLSPSMNVVDTSFKAVSTGFHLVDSLLESLRLALKCLSSQTILFPFLPRVFVTVVAHGIPGFGVYPLAVGEELMEGAVEGIVGKVHAQIKLAINELSVWLQQNFTQELVSGAHNCSRTRNPCTSPVCQANDVSVVIRDSLTAIAMTCSQLRLPKAGVNKSITVLSDGVMAHPRKLPYDNILMHLNFVDVALHILQIGGGFAPWSALGYASDPDLLRLLASSTPTGLFLQDHHLDPILNGSGGKSIFRPVANLSTNIFWMASTLKFSPITSGPVSKCSSHMPYRALTYQSSVLVQDSSGGRRTIPHVQSSYLSLIEHSAMKRQEGMIRLQGIDLPEAEEEAGLILSRVDSAGLSSSYRRPSFMSSQESEEETDENFCQEEAQSVVVQSLKSYLEPERAKTRPYLYKQYRLPGVSVAQILQVRANEGFLLETAAVPGNNKFHPVISSPSIHRAHSSSLFAASSLTRTSSATSLQASPSNGTLDNMADSRRDKISLRLNWGPVMDIIYEIAGDEESSSEEPVTAYVPRQSEEVRVKIFLRMPSGEFFLRFKQQVATQSGDTNLWQMCRQLDALIESIFSVDDTLTKLTLRSTDRASEAGRCSFMPLHKIAENNDNDIGDLLKTSIPKDVASWHRWFTVRNLFLILDVSADLRAQRIRHGLAFRLLEAARDLLVQDLTEFASFELEQGTSCRFFIKPPIFMQSHSANVLCATNETIASRLNGADSRTSVTDPVNPFMLVDLLPNSAEDGGCGVVRLNVAFFATCPQTQRASIDSLSHAFKRSKAILVDAPSSILRCVQNGLFQKSTVKRQTSHKGTLLPPIGMGAGESFYTYDPDATIVNRFLSHYAWENTCPVASVSSDVLSSIHEKRLKDGWLCVHETQNSILYVLLTPIDSHTASLERREYQIRDPTRHWIPVRSNARPAAPNRILDYTQIHVDWSGVLHSAVDALPLSRKSVRGACMCLSVQHVQARGEKPTIRCEFWADRNHPHLEDTPEDEIRRYAHELCSFIL